MNFSAKQVAALAKKAAAKEIQHTVKVCWLDQSQTWLFQGATVGQLTCRMAPYVELQEGIMGVEIDLRWANGPRKKIILEKEFSEEFSEEKIIETVKEAPAKALLDGKKNLTFRNKREVVEMGLIK